ncbi:MAG: MBOAT family O-acyltransferase [Chitinophagaceae bacterium]
MLDWSFDSFGFLFFLIPVLLLYRGVALLPWASRWQAGILALSGIVFYAVLQWQYLFLLAGSGLLAFYGARRLLGLREEKSRFRFLLLGISFHVAWLFLFKYSGALLITFLPSSSELSMSWSSWVLPLGISFFTFQLVAYWIDVYQENIEPETDLLHFMAYLFFFPKLLSGPITRVQEFMPQLGNTSAFDAGLASEGLTQWAWGLFKKRVVADTAAIYIQSVFMEGSSASGGDYWLACFLFPFQLYADFSGYSDMAIGIGKLFGIRLPSNFNYPFMARNISDYWQRWHQSLTGWMMDYIYTPCAFAWRRKGKPGMIMAITLTFVLVGLWHGPKWVFVVYGLVHSVYFMPKIIWPQAKYLSARPAWLQRLAIYSLVAITSVIIQAESMPQVFRIYSTMFTRLESSIAHPELLNALFLLPALGLLVFDYWGEQKKASFPLHSSVVAWPWLRRLVVLLIVLLLFYVQNEQHPFLYFQF